MKSDEAEKRIASLPQVVNDAALNTYVKNLTCKLAAEYCGDIRVYIVDEPSFNASMSANGMLLVYTGTLLRCENEAQLAFVLAHEIAHFKLRHAIAQYRTMRDGAGAMYVFTIVTLGVGGLIAALGMAGGFMSYSRDQEREADSVGFDIATARGYDPREAANLWTNVAAEDAADPTAQKRGAFTSSHPAPAERLKTMTEKANTLAGQRNDWTVNTDELRGQVAPWRSKWMTATLEAEDTNAFLTVLNRMASADPHSGDLQYYIGETYRRRNATGDADKARTAYLAAIADGDAPAAVYKGLGMIEMKAGRNSAARDAFDKYVSLVPTADDRAMVDYYRSHLGETQ